MEAVVLHDSDCECAVCSGRAPSYELDENQERFVRDAEDAGLDVYYDYSGRCMYGKRCPAVNIRYAGEFGTRAGTRSDSMGLGMVIYCPKGLSPRQDENDEDDKDDEDD